MDVEGTLISTWFVADTKDTATFFPQMGTASDAPESQAVYWRCVLSFYASSIAINPRARHIFFTNTNIPMVDGINLAKRFADWHVEVIQLPITYRLPKNAVKSWGNQFYVFDVLDWLASQDDYERAIILDSDCLWIQPVDDMAAAIDVHGALTLVLDGHEYENGPEVDINGQTRAGLARFLAVHGGQSHIQIPYSGGEIFAATAEMTRRISSRARALWPYVMAQTPDAPREEAHFLSVLYQLEGVADLTANPFIRRMWTTFHHHNVCKSDLDLMLWHLPAEKRTGFAELFRDVIKVSNGNPRYDAAKMGLTLKNYQRAMGVPRRGARKFVQDFSRKVAEKVKS